VEEHVGVLVVLERFVTVIRCVEQYLIARVFSSPSLFLGISLECFWMAFLKWRILC